MKLDRLYAKSSNGKIKVWEIEACGNVMITRSGYIDGKLNEQTKDIVGKNVGRSNETSDAEQCIAECKSKWQKKIDEQYVQDKDSIKEYADQEVLLPMLALNYQDRKHDIKFPCYVQPKLNGVRCIYQNGKFMSRQGKQFTTLDHLIPELKALGIKVPDGEIYIHGATFQEIIRLVKKDRGVDNSKLEYWIYDQINDKTFEERNTKIFYAFGRTKPCKLVYVTTLKICDENTIKDWHDEWVQKGFEGAIVRNADGKYLVKHRSKDLQKYKEFIDDEFEIVGGHEATGADAGTVVFEVKTSTGKVFSVRPKGILEHRKEWFKELTQLVGKHLTVRYQNLSEDGIPIFPVGIAVRDYE